MASLKAILWALLLCAEFLFFITCLQTPHPMFTLFFAAVLVALTQWGASILWRRPPGKPSSGEIMHFLLDLLQASLFAVSVGSLVVAVIMAWMRDPRAKFWWLIAFVSGVVVARFIY